MMTEEQFKDVADFLNTMGWRIDMSVGPWIEEADVPSLDFIRLSKLLIRYKEKSPWISVENRLPEDHIDVLARVEHDNDFHFHTGFYDINLDTGEPEWALGIGVVAEMNWDFKVTHWMPLPKPLKQ